MILNIAEYLENIIVSFIATRVLSALNSNKPKRSHLQSGARFIERALNGINVTANLNEVDAYIRSLRALKRTSQKITNKSDIINTLNVIMKVCLHVSRGFGVEEQPLKITREFFAAIVEDTKNKGSTPWAT